MKNPLRKRLPRELKGELGKYLVVFIPRFWISSFWLLYIC